MKLRSFVLIFISVIFLMTISLFGISIFAISKVATKASEQDYSGGIKPVLEKIWCGKPGCIGS